MHRRYDCAGCWCCYPLNWMQARVIAYSLLWRMMGSKVLHISGVIDHNHRHHHASSHLNMDPSLQAMLSVAMLIKWLLPQFPHGILSVRGVTSVEFFLWSREP
ncbi:hypothetical protein VTN02DRAFT_6778 [Thermoascus thermophilus]